MRDHSQSGTLLVNRKQLTGMCVHMEIRTNQQSHPDPLSALAHSFVFYHFYIFCLALVPQRMSRTQPGVCVVRGCCWRSPSFARRQQRRIMPAFPFVCMCTTSVCTFSTGLLCVFPFEEACANNARQRVVVVASLRAAGRHAPYQ